MQSKLQPEEKKNNPETISSTIINICGLNYKTFRRETHFFIWRKIE